MCQIYSDFTSYMWTSVCVYLVLCSFITWIDYCGSYHSQYEREFHQKRYLIFNYNHLPPTSQSRRCKETQVWTLGWEDPLEKEMAINSSVLAWEIPWTEDPGRLQSMESKESDRTEHTYTHTHLLSTPDPYFLEVNKQ